MNPHDIRIESHLFRVDMMSNALDLSKRPKNDKIRPSALFFPGAVTIAAAADDRKMLNAMTAFS